MTNIVNGRMPTGSARRPRILTQEQTQLIVRWVSYGLLWTLRSAAGFIIAFIALALSVLGTFRNSGDGSALQIIALGGLSALLVVRLFERFGRSNRAPKNILLWSNLELGTLFVAAAFVLIEMSGGPTALFYPLLYALVAFLVAFHTLPMSLYFIGLIVLTEAGIIYLQPEVGGLKLFLSHTSFTLLFAFLYHIFLRTEVASRKSQMLSEISNHIQELNSEAQDFRLTSALSLESRDLSREDLKRRRTVSSLQAIHESLYNVLAVAERALQPYTVALLWMDASDRFLKVKELRSSADHVSEKAIAAGEGFIGAIIKRREPLLLTNLKNGHPGVVYYSRPEAITDFVGVPVEEGQHLRGVLVADRKNNAPFDESDVAIMKTIAEEIMRAVQVERIFSSMDQEKFQKERFYQASREFNSTLTVEDVANVTIRAIERLVDPDFASLALLEEQDENIRIAAVRWKGNPNAEELIGESYATELGLAGAAIKAKHPLPHGTARSTSQPIFSPELKIDLAGVKVLPLLWKNAGVGALVLGSKSEDFLTLDLLEMVRVIADHAASAIANAQMYERMQRMATTDGLTGLNNHRYFQGIFDAALGRAERFGRKVSLLLTDIDHFKTINDTYGHPVGDRVLKRVARILEENARKTDVVARYGGEEFAVLMEETDTAGAHHIAERIREAIAKEPFHCENGLFNCTVSLGVATYPHDASAKAQIIDAADQALYKAKFQGRNQSVLYSNMKERQKS